MTRRRVLVVEDEEPLRELVARHLEKEGYEVAEASGAEEVLIRLSRDREPFDVVLSDIHLPGLSGVDLLRLLVNQSPLRPVIMITGDSDASLARQALEYGAAGYLLKPFELFELEAAVRQAIARLELVEAAETLAKSDTGAPADAGKNGAAIPTAWLELADSRSSAGEGHGARVARLAAAIASELDTELEDADRRALDVAARAHELGRLLGPTATPTELASRTAQLLYDLGVGSRVLRTVNQLRERWNGSGEPSGLSGQDIPVVSRVVAAADAIDHAVMARLDSGLEPAAAVEAALADVSTEAGKVYGPDVAGGLETVSSAVEAVWVAARGSGGDPPSPPRASIRG